MEAPVGQIGNVQLVNAGSRSARILKRIQYDAQAVVKKALEIDAAVYHFHDPELLLYVHQLQKTGAKIVYDVHEDLGKVIQQREHFPKILRQPAGYFLDWLEANKAKSIDAIITVTKAIQHKLSKHHSKVHLVQNFPILNKTLPKKVAPNRVVYHGGITKARGLVEIIKAAELVHDIDLVLAGRMESVAFEKELKALPGWQKVTYMNFLSREQLDELLRSCALGLVLFQALPNHIEAQPNKMFEYMEAEIPVVASNFPLWKEMIEGNQCGFCVDETNVKAIAEAISSLLENSAKATAMGKSGRRAVEEKYHWEQEEKTLFKMYKELIGE